MTDRAQAVDTKSPPAQRFGNDEASTVGDTTAVVDTKDQCTSTFGNDNTLGFIRVRKRKLKGGHASVRSLPVFYGARATASESYDLVRAVRVDGKPRHVFVLGLGSLKTPERDERNEIGQFWLLAIGRMVRHGLTDDQRQRLFPRWHVRARGYRRSHNVGTASMERPGTGSSR